MKNTKSSRLKIREHILTHYNERPVALIDTIVIHCMYAKDSKRQFAVEECVKILDELKLSAHYVVARDGVLWQLVPEESRAWHAGESCMPKDGRENVNDFSLGIELIGSPEKGFTNRQYEKLSVLTGEILARHPIKYIVGHEHIAPLRKVDPGPRFDWERYKSKVCRLTHKGERIKFGY